MRRIKIGNTEVGDGCPTYVILEIARTYKTIEEAKQLIRIAANNGVNAVKIQSILASELMINNSNTAEYFKMLQGLRRTKEQHLILQSECEKYGMDFLSTPEGINMTMLLEDIGVPAYKVSSLNLVYHDLLNRLIGTEKPVIISTGMGTDEEIANVVEMANRHGHNNVAILHCSSTYPTSPNDCNLRNISYLRDKFDGVIGFSDHSVGVTAPILSVAMGASIIEKHFTLDRTQAGADHFVGVDPPMLESMMKGIREAETMLGSYDRVLGKEEEMMRASKRRKIVLAETLPKNTVLDKTHLLQLQTKSSAGIDIKHIDNVVGKVLTDDLVGNTILEWENLSE